MEKEVKQVFRTALKDLTSESQVIRSRIRSSKGMDRWYEWQEKRSRGNETRSLLLAYAFCRGMPYPVAERKCGEFNTPSVLDICSKAEVYGGKPVDPNVIRQWLERRNEIPAQAAE